MPRRMLIDASHPEETRVVVLDGNKVEEFEFEAASKRPLKGNIYLAKITRVEPSLQAAFVEYGGNRQGFLAFSEIHPDYYQIPVADRMALLADQSRRLMAEEEEFDNVASNRAPAQQPAASDEEHAEEHLSEAEEQSSEFSAEPEADNGTAPDDIEGGFGNAEPAENGDGEPQGHTVTAEDAAPAEPAPVPVQLESTGVPVPEQRREFRPRPRRRQYKIQEVIKRRQVMLVQVVKEERGNKGASLTTFLSLAGRYCVLMPNTPRGGGISRKITSATDRRRLKSAAQSLELPEGMGLIIRTAGANRTKVEIKRDYEYLLRLWDSVRELTLKSNAPALVYEEGNLIKRSIRDLYNKDISEIVVDGEGGYRDAKDFMRMLMPSHAKNVKPYREPLPLFQSYHVEAQLDAMFSPTVTLRSGGYVVINQTEALVAIDVNSGKATREHSIEETAHKTNLEAADEIGRQLRLRDLAGLIVIDFIDMEDGKNDRNVEKRLRDSVRGDRARVQIGKISQFGLLEMSRQRLRAGVIAGSTVTCPHCAGVGLVRSTESAALRLLRGLDEEGQRQRAANFTVKAPEDIIIYTLNQKRREVARIEDAYDLAILFEPQNGMSAGSFEIIRTGARIPTVASPKAAPAVSYEAGFQGDEEEEQDEKEEAEDDVTLAEAPVASAEPREVVERVEFAAGGPPSGALDSNGKRRRRRRRRGGRGRGPLPGDMNAPHQAEMRTDAPMHAAGEDATEHDAPEEMGLASQSDQPVHAGQMGQPSSQPGHPDEGGAKRRRRRRGRRGRRREGEFAGPRDPMAAPQPLSPSGGHNDTEPMQTLAPTPLDAVLERAVEMGIAAQDIVPNAPSTPRWSLPSDVMPAERPHMVPESARESEPRSETRSERIEQTHTEPLAAPENEPGGETRKGWWQRRFKI